MVLLVNFLGINFLDALGLINKTIPLSKSLDNIIWGNSGIRFYKILSGFRKITTLFISGIIINFFNKFFIFLIIKI